MNEKSILPGNVEKPSGEEYFIPVFRFQNISSWSAAAPKRTIEEAARSILFTDHAEVHYVRVLLPPMNFD